jgi:Cof subfamily protein (haloacid dehalogenase superfamily)
VCSSHSRTTKADDQTLKLLASDLDGTLVGPSGDFSPRTQAMLDACAAAGVPVVFVTGRPPRWLAQLAQGRFGAAICANGALVVDLPSFSVLEATTMHPDVVLDVAARLRHVLPGATFALETLDGFAMEHAYVRRYDDGPVRSGQLEELLADGAQVVKVLLREPSSRSDDLLATARPVLAGVASPTHSNAKDGLLEIAALGVSKAAALARLAGHLNIEPPDVAAFGDMPNDIEMLQWAGLSYAMRGGHPEAVAAAKALAPPCEQDGVAQVVEVLLAGQSARR